MAYNKTNWVDNVTYVDANGMNNIENGLASHDSQLADITKVFINVMSSPYNAKGDGMNDDSIAIRSALSYLGSKGGGTLYFPHGTYLLSSYDPTVFQSSYYISEIKDNINIKGDGNGSILKVCNNIFPSTSLDTNGVNVFFAQNRKNISIKNIKIDFNGSNNLVPNGVIRTFYGIKFNGGENCIVENCYFDNCPGRNAILFGGWSRTYGLRSGAIIKNNTIHNGGSGVIGNIYQNDFSAIYSDWDNTIIEGNRILNDNEPTNGRGGVELHGNNQIMKNNYLVNCYPGCYICSDFKVWKPNINYLIGDIVIPTKVFYNGLQYKCITNGTSGSVEPSWVANTNDNSVNWSTNGNAVTINRVIENNDFRTCNMGVTFWSDSSADFDSVTIKNNRIGVKRITAIGSPVVYGIVQGGFVESGTTIPRAKNIMILDNEIYEDKIISKTSIQYVVGIALSWVNGLNISRNNIHDISSDAIQIQGNPIETNDIIIKHNNIKNANVNNVVTAKGAISINISGSSIIPSKSAFNISNVFISDNTITNTILDTTAYGFYFLWDTLSVITNLQVKNNTIINLQGMKSGGKASLVNVYPESYYSNTPAFKVDESGLVINYQKVLYSSSAGAYQTVTFSKPHNFIPNVQLTLIGSADSYVSVSGITATKADIYCSQTGRDIFIFSIG